LLDDGIGHVQLLAADRASVRLVAAGAEDGAAHREDAREVAPLEGQETVLHQPAEAVAEADHLHPVAAQAALPTPRIAALSFAINAGRSTHSGHSGQWHQDSTDAGDLLLRLNALLRDADAGPTNSLR
jgi:hypothetical protein